MRPPRRSIARVAAYSLSFAISLMRRKPLPVVGGISVTDACNLDCAHCWSKIQENGHASFSDIRRSLQQLYSLGARYLYIQGGEPFTWHDGDRTLPDVVAAAKNTGFFHVAVCTNGTYPLEGDPDSFSVSLDGRKEAHERIRPGSFDRVEENIRSSTHPCVFLNATFNRQNAGELLPLASLAASNSKLRGVLVNFHIPYPGVEYLALTMSEREDLAHRAIALKRKGYPILNTFAGLNALARNNWKRPLDLSVVTDGRTVYSCCRARGQAQICRECGYAGWAELSRIVRWDLISLSEQLRKLHTGPTI